MRPAPLPLSAIALALPLATTAAAQGGFRETGEEVGLAAHEFVSGLDRIGELEAMSDWCQQGIALGDLDGDGDQDVVALGGLATNHVFENLGGVFADRSADARIGSSELDHAPALGDVDLDGDLDLFVGALEWGNGPKPGRGRLYRNESGWTFEDVTALSGTIGGGHTIDALFADSDLDGLVDLWLAEFHGAPNLVYRNLGGCAFREIGETIGADFGGASHVVALADLDDDGLLDHLVGNDYYVALNTGLLDVDGDKQASGRPGGVFADVSQGSGMDLFQTTMGITFGDVNYDGLLDVYKTEVSTQFLLVNHGWPGSGQPWTQEQSFYGVDNPLVPDPLGVLGGDHGDSVGWGCAFLHADLDLWIDLFKVNGHVAIDPRLQRNVLFQGQGPGEQFRFRDATAEHGLLDYHDDRALAVGDMDSDGDLDLLVGPPHGRLRYYENRIARNGMGFLAVTPFPRTSAPGGHGVVARFTDSLGLPHVRPVGVDAPTASQNEASAFFGLGHEDAVDLSVRFPSGVVLAFDDVPPNTRLAVTEPELVRLSARAVPADPAGTADPIVVRAFAHDASGTPLDGGADVAIDAEGTVPLGGVRHVGGNEFQRAFRVPPAAGEVRIAVRFDDFEVRVRPSVAVIGDFTPAASALRATPQCVRAGSDDVARIELAPKDAFGHGLGAGRAVSFELAGDLVAAHDLGDGRYAATVQAPAEPGAYPVAASVDGGGAFVLGELEAAGPPRPSRTIAYCEIPDAIIAQDPDRMRLSVTPRDAGGLRLGPFADVGAVAIPDAGTPALLPVGDLAQPAQADGDFYFAFERPPHAGDVSGVVRVVAEGVPIVDVPYAY